MVFKRHHFIFVKLFITTALLRWICTAYLTANVAKTPSGSNGSRRNTKEKTSLGHQTKEQRYHVSTGSVSVRDLTFRSQINISSCSKCFESSRLFAKEDNNLFKQNHKYEARDSDSILNVNGFDHVCPLDEPPKTLITALDHFDANNKSSLLPHLRLAYKKPGKVFQETPTNTHPHKSRVKRFSDQVRHSLLSATSNVKTSSDFDESINGSLGTELVTSTENELNPNLFIATTMYGGVDEDESLTFTCEGRCGQRMSYPCSCSATCVIYDNCCDNMTQDCPHLWLEGWTRFKHVRAADIICNKHFIYTVVSCPKFIGQQNRVNKVNLINSSESMLGINEETINNKNWFLSNTSTSPKTEHIITFNISSTATMKTEQDSISQRFIAALSDAPVTDSDTGITFINRAVYDCHNMPDSTALPWALSLNFTFVTPTKLKDFDNGQEFNEYQPDFNKEIFKSHLCRPNMKNTCGSSADLKDLVDVYAKKCKKSNAMVYLFRNLNKTVYYRNKFCAFCNEGEHKKMFLSFANRFFFRAPHLQVLMSLSKSMMLTFKAANAESVSGSMVPLPWSYANCSVQNENSIKVPSDPERAELESRVVCSAICHHPSFTVRSDGICKAPHEALLAVADDGLSPLCPAAMTGLAKFLVCGLENEVESLQNADISSESVSIIFDSNLNRSLYVIEIHAALPKISSYIFSISDKDSIQNIYHAALLTKSFQNYRRMQKLCPHKKEKAQMTTIKVIRSPSIEEYVEYRGLNLSQGMEKLRGPRVEGQNKTTVCLTPVDGTGKADPNLLYCMEDAVYERDSELINKFSDSPCFSYLDNLESLGSNGIIATMEGHGGLLRWALLLDVLVAGVKIITYILLI